MPPPLGPGVPCSLKSSSPGAVGVAGHAQVVGAADVDAELDGVVAAGAVRLETIWHCFSCSASGQLQRSDAQPGAEAHVRRAPPLQLEERGQAGA